MIKKETIIYQYVKKILYIRIDHLGDLILSTPLLRAIHDNWRDREVHAVVTPYNQEVLQECPFVDEIRIFSHKWSLGEQFKFFMGLKKENFDLAIAHSPNMKSYIAAYMTGALHRVGYYYEERPLVVKLIKFLLTDALPLNYRSLLEAGKKVPHEVDKNLELAKYFGLEIKSRDLYLKPGREDFKSAVERFKEWHWKKGGKVFGIHLSDKWFKKGWKVKHFYRLAGEIQKKFEGSYVLFTYGSRDGDVGREINKFYKASTTVECAWDLSIKQWAALLKLCSSLISTDTGAVHVAASQKIPVIVIYSARDFDLNSQQFAPWRVKNKKIKQSIPLDQIKEIVEALADLETMY